MESAAILPGLIRRDTRARWYRPRPIPAPLLSEATNATAANAASHVCARVTDVRMTDDCGQMLDAEYSVEPDGDHLSVILESMSGRAEGRAPRNTDYRPALELLLKRLKARRAVIEAALVDSRRTRLLPEESRSLTKEPVHLVNIADVPALRRRLTNAQTTIGQAPGARLPGNSTKRIRLRLAVPGYGVSDAGRLAADLANSPSSGAAGEPAFSRPPRNQPNPRDDVEHPRGGGRSGGSGYIADQELKKAMELHAVQTVMDHYRVVEGYDVQNVGDRELRHPGDARGRGTAHRGQGFVRVGDKVDLTRNEVDHAHRTHTHLVIVDQIRWRRLPRHHRNQRGTSPALDRMDPGGGAPDALPELVPPTCPRRRTTAAPPRHHLKRSPSLTSPPARTN